MKKFLLNTILLFVLMLCGAAAWAQPVINYAGNTSANNYTFPLSTAIATQTPTNTGTPVGTFGTINGTWATTKQTGVQSAGMFYDVTTGGLYGTEYTYGELDQITLGAVVTNADDALFPGNTGYSVVTDASGTVYVCVNGAGYNEIFEFATGSYGATSRKLTGFTAPKGLAIDASNNLYVVDAGSGAAGNGKIYKFAPGATTLTSATTTFTGLNNPFGIAISGNNIYFTQYIAGTLAQQGIFEIANGVTGSTTVSTFSAETTVNTTPFGANPRNLTFDSNGNLYVADYTNAKIERISPTGVVTNIITAGLTNPNQITFDPAGNLYVGDLTKYYKKDINTYFSYTGTLPPGLSFNYYTGAITGAPTTTGTYTIMVTAASTSGTSAAVTVNFYCGQTTLTYPTPTVLSVGYPASIIPTFSNGYPTGATYVSIPAGTTLSSLGLGFDAHQGIVGTPGAAFAPVTFVVNATNAAGTTTSNQFVISCVAPPAFSYGGPYTFTTGTGAIPTISPTITSGGPITSATISPALPATLSMDASGNITGSPTAVSPTTTYTVTGKNSNGGAGTATVVITCNPPPPTISYSPSSYTDTVGIATMNVTPIVTNAPTSYSISPNLTTNTGLMFSTTTGVISGTPTAVSASVPYTVTATNAGGSVTTMVTFTCVNTPPPVLAYTPNYYSLGLMATVSFTISNTGGPVAGNYTISPTTLPAGLTFNATTGTISGTTTATASAVMYTISGTNAGGTAMATITIGVSTQAIAFDYNPNSYTLNVGAALPTNIIPEVSGGAPTSGYSYNTGTVILTNASTPAPVSSPLGMATDASGNLYVVNNITAGTITKYSTTGTVSLFGTGATFASAPIGIVFDSSGNAYVLTKTNIYVFNSAGVYQPTITFSGIAGGVGICIDQSNNIFVASNSTYTATEFPSTGGVGTVVETAPAGYEMTGGIAVDGNGYLYVVDAYNNTIDIYNPFQIGQAPTSINIPAKDFGVSVDPGDDIYVSYTGKVAIYSQSSGSPVLALTLTGFTSPRGTVTDNTGNLYVSDYTANTVTKYTQVSGYYITSTLAAGLTFNNKTGQFSGTPFANFSATYTVYGYNSNGSGSTTISFNCNTAGPAIHYSPNTYVFAQNIASPTITPISTGSFIPSDAEYYEKQPIFTASTTPVASGPWGMAYDPTGNVYVVNYTSKNIMKYNPLTQAISTFVSTATYAATGAGAPIGIAFDPSGNADVLTANGVYQFNSSGNYVSEIITGLTGGTGITISLYNNVYSIYVANSNTDIVAKYALTGGTGTTVASGYAITGGVAVDGSGNVYVANGSYLDEYSNAGTRSARTYYGAAIYGVNIDGSNNIFATTATTDFVGSSTLTGGLYYLDQTFTSARGILTDKYGNLYVSDYGANAVYIYTPYNGYYLSGGPLPNGLSFNNATGQFTGTPTTLFNTITFTVTAWNSIGSSSTPITFTCIAPLNWVGTTSNDWNVGSNWTGGSVPNSTQTAFIGATAGAAYSYPVIPTISASENINVGSIIMGTQNLTAVGPGIIVNGTLATPTITYQGDARSTTNPYTAAISGTGTITTGNITVNANYSTGAAYNEVIQSSVSNMIINNSITLTSTNNGTKYYNPAYNITSGIVTLNGIVTTNNGSTGNTSTLTVNNTILNISHPIVLSGLSSTGNNVVTFNGTNTLINYNGTGAPQTYYTATGLNTTTGGVTYTNIQFSGNGIKNPNTINSALSISGNFTNTLTNDANGSLTLTNTPVTFTGTTAETLIGGPGSTAAAPANPGNGTIFSNVTFSGASTKTMSTGVFHVANTGLLTMSGTSASTILNVAAAANLTLNSNLYGSATVTAISGVPGTSGPSITGLVDAQRYISGGSSGYRGYRMLSSQVNANSPYVNINYLIKSTYMTGTTGTAGGFDGGPNPTLYFFRENLVPSNATFISGNFRGVNNITSPPAYGMDIDSPPNYHLPVGNGYLFFFRGDRSVTSYTAETMTTYVPTATTLTATGNLNQGSITFNNWYTGSGMLYSTISGTTTVEGYNLVGNPYASSIDWDKSTSGGGTGITTSNVKPYIYVIDPVSKNYNVYKAGNGGVGNIATANSNILASGQGFFVVASTTGATLTFNESGKSNTQVASGNRNLFMGVPPVATAIPTIHLVLLSDSVIMDGTVINFDNNAKTQYADVDAPHKVGFGTATLASRSTDSVALAYYTLPYPKGSQTIPLNVFAEINGTYQLYLRSLQNIPSIYDVWLKDAYAKDSLDIKHNPTYSFTVNNSDATTFGKERFSLVIRQNPALMVHLLSFTATKITGGDQVVWTTENEQNYTNFVVQRSTDGGKTFNLLEGIVSSAQGTYSYLDKNPVQGANSYRLQLTDLNGTITYSNIVTIMYANTGNQIAINGMLLYPNPTSGTVNLAIDQSTTTQATASSATTTYNIQIINNLGSIIKTAVSSSPNWQADVSTLIPGTYFIRVTNASTNSVVGKSAFVKL